MARSVTPFAPTAALRPPRSLVYPSRSLRPAVLGLTVGALAAGGVVLAPAASAAPSTTVVISEVYGGGGNPRGTPTNDFIELHNLGTEPGDLSPYAGQSASSGGSTWSRAALTGTLAPGGYYLVQGSAGAGGTQALPAPDATGSLNLSATAGKVALTSTRTALTCSTCAGTGSVVDLVGYGTATVGAEGTPAANLSNSTSASRTAGPDTDDHAADFTVGDPSPQSSGSPGGGTPGGGGSVPDAPVCGTTPVTIGSVQGTTDTSPMVGQTVTVAGTVVGDLQQGGFNGVFVQDGGDGTTATSDGIFVYGTSLPALDRGDTVVVRGTVTEFKGSTDARTLTELSSASVSECTGLGLTPPAPSTLPLPSTDAQREALEGMLVAPADDLTVTEVFNLNRFGEIMLAQGGRLITPTEEVAPGPEAAARVAANAARSLLLDDGVTANLPGGGRAPPSLPVDAPVGAGAPPPLEPVVLSYGFNAWRLEPADGTAAGTTFEATNPRPVTPPAVSGDLRIADFNVLNYFVTFGGASRGAPNQAEQDEQEAKLVTAITALGADVITLHEIENSAVTTPGDDYRAVQTLIAAIEAADGHDWDYVRAHEDTDVITNAVIYRTDRVASIGDPQVPTEAQLAAFANARTPIAQTFRAGDEVFSVIANHLKSKGSACGAASDDISAGGAGNCNGDRVLQAQVLRDFAAAVAQHSGDADVVLTGDFNAYRFEPPLDVLRDAGFQEAVTPGEYSYVFDGGSGSLDHVFATASMYPKIVGHAIWDINAVESFAYEYDGYEGLYAPYPYRASDHNPTIIGLDPPAVAGISDPKPVRGERVTLTGTAFDAGTNVRATLPARNGQVLGTAVARPDGTVSMDVTVPAIPRPGSYDVVLTAADGETATTSFTLRPPGLDVAPGVRGR